MDKMTRGRLAEAAGCNAQTLRFYERKGLLPDPGRTASGYRAYGADSLKRVLFIRRAQRLGFSLEEIARLLRLRISPRQNCAPVKEAALARLHEVRFKIKDLRRMEAVLEDLVRSCERRRATDDCPILDSIGEDFK